MRFCQCGFLTIILPPSKKFFSQYYYSDILNDLRFIGIAEISKYSKKYMLHAGIMWYNKENKSHTHERNVSK